MGLDFRKSLKQIPYFEFLTYSGNIRISLRSQATNKNMWKQWSCDTSVLFILAGIAAVGYLQHVICFMSLHYLIICVSLLSWQSLVSEEDDDEDEEEGKTAVQADDKTKNNKPGLQGTILFFSNLKYTRFIIE